MNPVWIVLVLILLSYVVYYILKYALLPAPPLRIGEEAIDLSKITQVITGEDLGKATMNTSGSTLVFYINPIINDRTSQNGTEYATPVNIGESQKFNILIAPDAGRSNMMAPATLTVTEKGSNGSNTIETIELASFPLQRWTGVAIVNQGSKINIYINGLLSASHKCTAMPIFTKTNALNVGDTRLQGQIALMSLAPYPMQAADIKSMYMNTIDTEGKPYLSSGTSFFSIPTLNISCPGGNCFTPTAIPGFEQWSSQY